MRESLSIAEARRVTIRSLKLHQRTSDTKTSLSRMTHHLGAVQIDSVNVFARSHYMPLFSRLGHYDRADFDRLAFEDPKRFTEYWAHCAAVIPTKNRPLFGFRMEEFRQRTHKHSSWFQAKKDLLPQILNRLQDEGPQTASALEESQRGSKAGWWDWSDTKRALEWLFLCGDVAVARRENFQRVYALAEHVIPPAYLRTDMPREDAVRQLLQISLRNYGIGTLPDLADYFRLSPALARQAIHELVEDGLAMPVSIAGSPAFADPKLTVPRQVDGVSILSPFDPLLWHRPRTKALFGMDYRIEIYTPAKKRQFGYYSLPILVDDRLSMRADLKADRKNSCLMVQSAWWHDPRPEDAQRIANEIRLAAMWQGLDSISIGTWGDATDALATNLAPLRHHTTPSHT